MKKINTHGLKMTGLEEASKTTINWGNTGGRTQICYDKDTGEVLATDLVGEHWVKHNDPAIVTICYAQRHLSQQEIADMIARSVEAAGGL